MASRRYALRIVRKPFFLSPREVIDAPLSFATQTQTKKTILASPQATMVPLLLLVAAQQNKNENSDNAMVFPHRALELPRRSLLILTDFARFNRQHYIPKRKSDPMIDGTRRMRTETRYSLTIRQTINNDNINTNNNNENYIENGGKQLRSCDCQYASAESKSASLRSRSEEKKDATGSRDV